MKKYVIGLILGIIISASIVYATTYIKANEISYTDKGNNKITVESALNNLYNQLDNDYSNKPYTTEGLTFYNNRITILDGGYYVDNNNVTWVNITMKFNTSLSATNIWLLIQGLPNVSKGFTVIDKTNRHSFVIGNYNTGTNALNLLSANSVNANDELTVQFKY